MALTLNFLNAGEKFTLSAHITAQDVNLDGANSTLNIHRVSYFKMGMDSDVILERRVLTVTIEMGNRFLWGFLEEMASGGYVPRLWRKIEQVESADHAQLLVFTLSSRTFESGSTALGNAVADFHFHEIESIVDDVWRFYKQKDSLDKMDRLEKISVLQVVDDFLQHIQNFRYNLAKQNYSQELRRS